MANNNEGKYLQLGINQYIHGKNCLIWLNKLCCNNIGIQNGVRNNLENHIFLDITSASVLTADLTLQILAEITFRILDHLYKYY